MVEPSIRVQVQRLERERVLGRQSDSPRMRTCVQMRDMCACCPACLSVSQISRSVPSRFNDFRCATPPGAIHRDRGSAVVAAMIRLRCDSSNLAVTATQFASLPPPIPTKHYAGPPATSDSRPPRAGQRLREKGTCACACIASCVVWARVVLGLGDWRLEIEDWRFGIGIGVSAHVCVGQTKSMPADDDGERA